MKFPEIEKFLRMTNDVCKGASISCYKERIDSNEMKKNFVKQATIRNKQGSKRRLESFLNKQFTSTPRSTWESKTQPYGQTQIRSIKFNQYFL